MNTQRLACASCGAPIQVPENLKYLNCTYCGASLSVERGEGYSALRIAEEVTRTIEDVGKRTETTIREGTQVTREELQRLQLSQEYSAAQNQLLNIRAEIRALERQEKNRKVKEQVKELREQERIHYLRVQELYEALHPIKPGQVAEQYKQIQPRAKEFKDPKYFKGCAAGCLSYMIVGVMCVVLASPIDELIFSTSIISGDDFGTFSTIGALFGFVFGCLVFLYITLPDLSIFKPVKKHIEKRAKKTIDKKQNNHEDVQMQERDTT